MKKETQHSAIHAAGGEGPAAHPSLGRPTHGASRQHPRQAEGGASISSSDPKTQRASAWLHRKPYSPLGRQPTNKLLPSAHLHTPNDLTFN